MASSVLPSATLRTASRTLALILGRHHFEFLISMSKVVPIRVKGVNIFLQLISYAVNLLDEIRYQRERQIGQENSGPCEDGLGVGGHFNPVATMYRPVNRIRIGAHSLGYFHMSVMR